MHAPLRHDHRTDQAISGGETLSPPESRERTAGWWLLIFFILTFGSFGTEGPYSPPACWLGFFWAPGGRSTSAPRSRRPAWWPKRENGTTMSAPVDLSGYHPAEGTAFPPGRRRPAVLGSAGTAPSPGICPSPASPQPVRRKPGSGPVPRQSVPSVPPPSPSACSAPLYQNDEIGRDLTFTPAAEAELQDHYQGEIGSLEVDLRQLPPLDDSHRPRRRWTRPVNVHLPSAIP